MNKKGQALVEFILIVPVIIMLLFAIIDFSRIYYEKSRLENISSDIINITEDETTYDDLSNMVGNTYKDVDLSIKYMSNGYMELKISKNITLITPGIKFILSNPYEVSTKRYIPYE